MRDMENSPLEFEAQSDEDALHGPQGVDAADSRGEAACAAALITDGVETLTVLDRAVPSATARTRRLQEG